MIKDEQTVIAKSDLELITASEIEPKEVEFLWYPYFPLGKVSIVQGDPGDGKSTFLLDIAAKLTNGEILPFSEPDTPPEPIKVIYQTTEDDADDTVVPRFIRAGGNRDRLIFIKEDKKTLTFADDRIDEAIKRTGAKVLILDPLSSYIGDCSLNSANEVRPKFNYLIRYAKENHCCIIVVNHLNKGDLQKVLYRTPGSIDVVGAVRSVVTIIRDSDDRDKRYFVQTKSNLAKSGSAFTFSIDENGITYLEEVDVTPEELMNNASASKGRPDDRLQEAMLFISDMLADGPVSSKECEERLREAGIKATTAKKAKKKLGVVSSKPSLTWTWSLP